MATSGEYLTFTCEACHHALTVPLHLAGVRGPCPQCGETIQAPDRRGALSVQPLSFECASCQKTLTVGPEHFGARGPCPHCGEEVVAPHPGPAQASPSPLAVQKAVLPAKRPSHVRPPSLGKDQPEASPDLPPTSLPRPRPEPAPEVSLVTPSNEPVVVKESWSDLVFKLALLAGLVTVFWTASRGNREVLDRLSQALGMGEESSEIDSTPPAQAPTRPESIESFSEPRKTIEAFLRAESLEERAPYLVDLEQVAQDRRLLDRSLPYTFLGLFKLSEQDDEEPTRSYFVLQKNGSVVENPEEVADWPTGIVIEVLPQADGFGISAPPLITALQQGVFRFPGDNQEQGTFPVVIRPTQPPGEEGPRLLGLSLYPGSTAPRIQALLAEELSIQDSFDQKFFDARQRPVDAIAQVTLEKRSLPLEDTGETVRALVITDLQLGHW